MYRKKIVPVQVLNDQATEFICELSFISDNFTSRKFEIEFYSENNRPLLSREGTISGLPVNAKLIENDNSHTFDYSSHGAQLMFEEQDKLIFEHIKRVCGLEYYDDTFEKDVEYTFSYERFFSEEGKFSIVKPFPVDTHIYGSQKKSDGVQKKGDGDFCIEKFINDEHQKLQKTPNLIMGDKDFCIDKFINNELQKRQKI